jgi:hypothetical protein
VDFKTFVLLFILFYFATARSWDDYEPCSCPDIQSWEVPQVNPYEDTIIVPDPYGED